MSGFFSEGKESEDAKEDAKTSSEMAQAAAALVQMSKSTMNRTVPVDVSTPQQQSKPK